MEDYQVSRFDRAILLLPTNLRDAARQTQKRDRCIAEEIRLRIGRAPTILRAGIEHEFSAAPVTRRDLEAVLDIATQASAHSLRDNIRSGYITVHGGYRIGLCGTVTTQDGQINGYKNLSSVAIRISREIHGASDSVIRDIAPNGKFKSTLIISPPGIGKTTLLRDCVRVLSSGGSRVALADERSEVAAMYDGKPQMDVGERTDILDGCPKADAVLLLLKVMNPQIIALDEITAPADVRAIEMAANCGVKLLATAHAESIADLSERQIYRELLSAGIFERAVILRREGDGRTTETEVLK